MDRVHSAYLFAGPGPAPRETALWFVRALVCEADPSSPRPCEACSSCRRSSPGEAIPLDGEGKKGPLLRHIGDHPDLLFVERGSGDTRVRIDQVRAVQRAFRLRSSEGRRRAAVIADAEWLNKAAQNALLRLLEEPPPGTSLVLVSASSAGLLATVRSRCQRLAFPAARPEAPDDPRAPEATQQLAARLATLSQLPIPDLLDWAAEYRGARPAAAEGVDRLLHVASAWLHQRACRRVDQGQAAEAARPELQAFSTLQRCRQGLAERNANPQMVAERALLALREALC